MTDKADEHEVLINRDLVWATLHTIESMEAWIDGACTVSGQHSIPPSIVDGLYELKEDLHAAVCDKCSNHRAPQPRHKPAVEGKVIKPAAFNAGEPKDGGAA